MTDTQNTDPHIDYKSLLSKPVFQHLIGFLQTKKEILMIEYNKHIQRDELSGNFLSTCYSYYAFMEEYESTQADFMARVVYKTLCRIDVFLTKMRKMIRERSEEDGLANVLSNLKI